MKIEAPYVVVQCHTTIKDDKTIKVPIVMLERIIKYFNPIPVVLLGTHFIYSNIQNCTNLVGVVDARQAKDIIQDSFGFIGPEGILAYIALSTQIYSIIFYIEEQLIEEELFCNPWKKYIISCIKI